MDEAGSRARIGTMTRPPEIKAIEAEIEEIKNKKEKAIKNQDFEGAASMRDKEKQAKENLESTLATWRAAREEKRVVVDEDDILHVVAKWTGIPHQTHGPGRNPAPAHHRDRDGKGRHRPARGRLRHLQGVAPFPRRLEGPAPAHRHVSVARPHRRRQDPSGQDPGRTDVRRLQGARRTST